MSLSVVYCSVPETFLFHRIVAKRCYTLLAVLASAYSKKDSWLKTVHNDLNKLASVEGKLEEYREASMDQWYALISGRGHIFLKVLRVAISLPEVNKVAFWWPQQDKRTSSQEPQAIMCPTIFQCLKCGYECKTPQAHSWHMYDRHGDRHYLRSKVHGTACECCMRDFHTRERVCTHVVASSKRCREFYDRYGSEVGSEVLAQLEEEAYSKTKRTSGRKFII